MKVTKPGSCPLPLARFIEKNRYAFLAHWQGENAKFDLVRIVGEV